MKHITKVEKIERQNFSLLIPHGYKPLLDVMKRGEAAWEIKKFFTRELERRLELKPRPAPLYLDPATGLQDNLNGVETAVRFDMPSIPGTIFEVPHSLAKWKRWTLGEDGYQAGRGIWTDMHAVRRNDGLDSTHSGLVRQYDWERVIAKGDRTPEFLQLMVMKVYGAMRAAEGMAARKYGTEQILRPDIQFIHTEDLERDYPKLTPRERENMVTKDCGAVFIRGIGAKLPLTGVYHDGRAPDYDDWSTVAADGKPGLNGDIFVWHPVLQIGLELSSMGIRVDAASMEYQLEERNCTDRRGLPFHQKVLTNQLPLSVGGGIGQDRLNMFILRAAHIGEVFPNGWPAEMREILATHGITLLQ